LPTRDSATRELVDELLALPTRRRQEGLLRARGLLDAAGLDGLLDVAERLLEDDPEQARYVAEICQDLAGVADAPGAVPRATYVRAGVHSVDGEFEEDLRLTGEAFEAYVSLGMSFEALRTNVGRMAALLELGRYQQALDVGRVVLDTLAGGGQLDVAPTQAQADLLVAAVHHNRGGCLEYMGRYEEALNSYYLAEEKYRGLGMTERVGGILMNRGAMLLNLGRGTEGLADQEAAAEIFDGAGLHFMHTKALVNIGEAHLRLGNYTLSLRAFERARRHYDERYSVADSYLFLRHIADAYLELNLYSEALSAYREATESLRVAGMPHDSALALQGTGSVLIARSELEEAERVLTEAVRLFDAAGNVPMLTNAMLEQASVLQARGDLDAALAVANRALALVSGDEWTMQRIYAHMRLADLLLPRTAEVEPHLLEAQRLSEDLTLPQLRYRLNERLGRLRLLQGREAEARELLETAIGDIERLRGNVTQESMRASFLRDKVAAYENLLRLHLARDGGAGTDPAFAVAERAKSRALVDLLTGVVGAEEAETVDPEREAKLQSLQADLNATYGRLLGGPGDDEPRVALSVLNGRAVELEEEISRLRLQRATAGSSARPFASPMPLDGIQDQLTEDVTLLAYHLIGDEVIAFVQAKGRVRVARHLGTVDEVQRLSQRLIVQWDRFRMGREFASRNLTLLERSTRQLLSALYGLLVAPLEPLLEELDAGGDPGQPRKLAVVPHGLLHQVPFHALFDGERYLIERFEISYAPSATVYALCQRQQPGGSGKALIMGAEDPSIPTATLEARAVAQRLSGAELRTGVEATIEALKSNSPGCDVLHLACHGLFRSDNPMFSSLRLQDGWLTAADAMDLDLSGALVVLSACESGRNEVIGGDEVIGLTRAFLGAGAATLMVSLWLVQDETTAELMGGWYERLRAGEERAAALRAAQLEIKERYSHPYYWAPFVLIGKR
jgi:tetratricopeptide (TPR) repeat protein